MKYLKTYDKPQVGNYVICQENNAIYTDDIGYGDEFDVFLSNNVGRCIKILPSGYLIEYSNSPHYLKSYFRFGHLIGEIETKCRRMALSEIVFWSNKKSDCETYIAAKKYNL